MKEKVYLLLQKIPKGKVTTYGELAKVTKLHPRTIGMLMGKNKDPVNFPCYKVVRSDGTLGGYSGGEGTRTKIKLLKKDGVDIKNGKINLKKHLFKF